jgi:hypothetical protein
MVEQLPVKELVPGSSPGRGAREKAPLGAFSVVRENYTIFEDSNILDISHEP